MVAAAFVSQRELVHCPLRWYFCAWRRLPGSRSETMEDGAGEEAPCTRDDGGPAPVRRTRSSMR